MSDTLFDPGPATVTTVKERPGLSADARRTIRNRELIAAGVHPATRQPILVTGLTCATCGHHRAVTHYTSREKTWHKCALHRLGVSHSAASDIRTSWPACVLYQTGDDQ